MRTLPVILALVCAVVSSPLFAQAGNSAPGFVERLADAALVAKVRQGGYVLYMRHGNTDNTQPDQVPVDLRNCATQRPLNDAGRKTAVAVGKAVRAARWPIAELFHSPLCRARESAELAFPEWRDRLQSDDLLMYTANLTSKEKAPVLARTRELLSSPVPLGKNRLILAHAPNMADLIGYFVKPEGTIVIIKPLGDSRFEYLGSIHPDMWGRLSK